MEQKIKIQMCVVLRVINKYLSEEKKQADIAEKKLVQEENSIETSNASSNEGNTNVTLLKQLADLHAAGVLTDEEFSSKKNELLLKIK